MVELRKVSAMLGSAALVAQASSGGDVSAAPTSGGSGQLGYVCASSLWTSFRPAGIRPESRAASL
jgi:hypothetical protein